MTAKSPPTSPLPKRQKPNPTPTIASTMDSSSLKTSAVDTQGNPVSPAKSIFGAANGHSLFGAIPPLKVKRLSDKAKTPTRGSAGSAGYDLYCAKDTIVPAKGKVLVPTDIAIAVPAGTYGRIAPRSGLASRYMIDTGAGVIDSDYRGHVQVLLFNHGDSDFELYHGDRIAQLVLERIANPEVVEVDELEESVRGVGGFGSTGGFGPRTGAQVQAQAEAVAAPAEALAQPFGSAA